MTFSLTPASSAICESRPSAPTTSLLVRVVSAPSRSRIVTPLTVPVAQQARRGLAEMEVDARCRRRRLAHHRVEDLAAQVDPEAGLLGRRLEPAPLGPGLDPRALAAGGDDRIEQVEAFERRHRGGLDEVRADPLEGLRVGLFLDQGDPQALAPEQDRRRAAREAAADDDRVVVGGAGAVAGSGVVHVDLPLRVRLQWYR